MGRTLFQWFHSFQTFQSFELRKYANEQQLNFCLFLSETIGTEPDSRPAKWNRWNHWNAPLSETASDTRWRLG